MAEMGDVINPEDDGNAPFLYDSMDSNGSGYNASDYEYDYNITDSFELPLKELVPLSLMYCLTLLLGMADNSLVIFAICRYKRLQSVTNIFLLSLASADLLLVLICVPIKVNTEQVVCAVCYNLHVALRLTVV